MYKFAHNSFIYEPNKNKIYYGRYIPQPFRYTNYLGILNFSTEDITFKEFTLGITDIMYLDDYDYILSSFPGYIEVSNEQGLVKTIEFEEKSGETKFIRRYP